MIDEGILNKESRLVALYGVNAQTSPFLKVLNTAFKTMGLNDFAIGLNIKPEDFAYMVKGMPDSKVKMALYEPEYQETASDLMDVKEPCVSQSGHCDGAYAKEGKLHGVCFSQCAFETMLACEAVTVREKRVLLLGAGSLAKAILPLLGIMKAASVDIAAPGVEEADAAIRSAGSALAGVATDILWYRSGMAVDMARYDMIINAMDLHAHRDKRILDASGENRSAVLIDFVRAPSSFDTLSERLGCRKIGNYQWMSALSLCVAKRWLGAEGDCDVYNTILNNLGVE